MLLLTILTGAAAATLLIVLGWALKQIARALESIQRNMENIAMGVRAIDKETAILAGVEQLNQTLSGVVAGGKAIGSHLTKVEQNLKRIASK